MTRKHEILSPEERAKLLDALHGIRKAVQWKPGSEKTTKDEASDVVCFSVGLT